VTVDGYERTFATNHLAYFLLANELLPALEAGAPARIVNVASDAHQGHTLDFADLHASRRYFSFGVYGRSKLANILFTRELARRLAGTGVTVNCLHPGAVATGLGKNNGWLARGITGLLKPFFRTPEQGARTTVFLASSPEVEGITGGYFVDSRERRPSAAARNDDDARKLWRVSAEMTGLHVAAA